MEIPTVMPYEDMAVDAVVSVVNKAQEKLGVRQNLFQIAHSRKFLATHQVLSLVDLKPPLVASSEKFIKHAIEKVWRLTESLAYYIKYLSGSQDEVSQYYYFEVVFSQPTVAYPIPQVTCSVFFRVGDKHIDPPDVKSVPEMFYRIEGQHRDYDVRLESLTLDWILAVLQMKSKFFKRVEELRMF